jgi:hypothetical protein
MEGRGDLGRVNGLRLATTRGRACIPSRRIREPAGPRGGHAGVERDRRQPRQPTWEAPKTNGSNASEGNQRFRESIDTVGVTGSIPVSPTMRPGITGLEWPGPYSVRVGVGLRSRSSRPACDKRAPAVQIGRPGDVGSAKAGVGCLAPSVSTAAEVFGPPGAFPAAPSRSLMRWFTGAIGMREDGRPTPGVRRRRSCARS